MMSSLGSVDSQRLHPRSPPSSSSILLDQLYRKNRSNSCDTSVSEGLNSNPLLGTGACKTAELFGN